MRCTILALALPALTLAGCDHYRGIEPLHQPVVARADYSIDVATARGHLAPGERERLDGWMDSMRVGFGDRVTVDDPTGYATGVRGDVAGEAARYGLLLADTPPLPGAPIAPGTARVTLSRASATVPGCPDFSMESVPNFDAHTSPNYGCATNRNIAAMVADPEDLVRGDAGTHRFDASQSGKAIKSYRDAPPTGKDGLPGGVTSTSVVKTGG